VEQVEERLQVMAPAVGIWREIPASGTLVGPRSIVGSLRQMHLRFRLEMPEGVSGVMQLPDPRHSRALAYGEVMFELIRLADDRSEQSTVLSDAAEVGDPGLLALSAPTDGVFYSRPAPDAPAFVQVGQQIRRGQPVGLIEVMKTFNQIVFDGAHLPDEGTIAEIRVGDGEEVSAGQPLIVLG
jgi:acetyl-CoA carboxylase biotin carboxyl carrier protein